MKDLYDVFAARAISGLVDEVVERHPEITRKLARTLVLNSLIYNVVIAEVVSQVEFLADMEVEE